MCPERWASPVNLRSSGRQELDLPQTARACITSSTQTGALLTHSV
jgi:hypothetical protein